MKVTVTEDHCHSIGHIRFSVSLLVHLCVSLSYTVSEILSVISNNLKWTCDPERIPVRG